MSRPVLALLLLISSILCTLLSCTAPSQGQTLAQVESEHPEIIIAISYFNETLGGQVEALQAAHETLTIFAPENTAIRALPQGALANLERNHTLLQDVLLYHMLHGNYTARDLEERGAFRPKTLFDNNTVLIEANASGVTVNGYEVVTPDVFFDLGVIHIIDGVLIPPEFRSDLLG
ncbi:hypothetical protein CDCA_CDCA01G0225 [Cyanidium caldarium]|uniref:FAS1 domain-containing protein n=1 Tax=Cyanidium caldarium TaxID=2771 RepID=A0AAV9IPG1_CYACA|nr:hypothetical protein CDCA_CDCA01G0225 [Cyanidium caldarium]